MPKPMQVATPSPKILGFHDPHHQQTQPDEGWHTQYPEPRQVEHGHIVNEQQSARDNRGDDGQKPFPNSVVERSSLVTMNIPIITMAGCFRWKAMISMMHITQASVMRTVAAQRSGVGAIFAPQRFPPPGGMHPRYGRIGRS